MTIAVTAASGQLGGEIVKALAHQGADVIGLARTPKNAAGLGVDIRPGDYNDPAALEQSLSGIDAVLLVSGMDAPDRRIDQHRNVINAAKKAGVRKMVYTSVQGAETGNAFAPIIQSNRQTEQDVRESGLDWSIGRNGIYIEPDVEYIATYARLGFITNCAGDGKCGYTTRPELAYAYAKMLTEDRHNQRTYNLHGTLLTQAQLASYLGQAFQADLAFRDMDIDEYRAERIEELGEFIGGVIAGIYEGIRQGANDAPSDYATAAGRDHQSWESYFGGLGRQK
jgi:NAD(P)H dehydrogenase (quinone)